MESITQSKMSSGPIIIQEMPSLSNSLTFTKKTAELTSAAESSAWTLIDSLLSADNVTKCDIEQSFLLQKLAAAPEVGLSLARDILKKILKHEVDINMMDKNKDTAVVVAARCDNTKMVMELLSRQAALPPDVTHVCSFLQTLTNNWKPQETPYMHALVVKLLWDRLQDTALHSCHKQLHHTLVRLAVTFHTSLVREMFVTEQQVNSVDSEGMAVLHRVAMFDSDDHVRLLHYFISKGANVNLQNTSGDTPLHIAAKNSNWMMMEALLHRQAYSDVTNCEQLSVLHIMASYTDSKRFSEIEHLFQLLIFNNNNVNKKDGEGNTALHLAALAGNITFMKTLLDHGARADGVNDEQKTVLHMMAMAKKEVFSNINSCINVLVLTLKKGVDIQQKNCDGNSALHLAAKHDNGGLVEFLLKYVDDAAQPDSEGFNILHRLAMTISSQGHSLFHKVAQKVGDINAKSKTGDTAIQLAAKCQNWDMVKLLEQEGAAWDELDSEGFHVVHRYAMGDNKKHYSLPSFLENSMHRNPRCWTGDTVLHLAARHGNWSVVKLIVEDVDDINEVDSEGFTVIQRLVMSPTDTFYDNSLISHLIELGADYTCRDQNGDTVLHLATKYGHWKIVKHLANLGAEADTPDSEGFSVLHRIATTDRSHLVTVEEFAQHGTSINHKNLQGNTPLHLAVHHQNWTVAEKLVNCGADVNDVDAEGFTVLHRLGQIQNSDYSCKSLIQLLLEKGAKCDIKTNKYETVSEIIVQNENWSMMKCLLDQGTLVFREYEDKCLLHQLVCSHHGDDYTNVCDLLIEKGLSVNAKNCDGNSLLHLAAGAGNWKLVEHLIQKGARENMVDSKGLSILHRFVTDAKREMYNYAHSLDTIIASSVDLNALDPRGNTALQIAAKRRLMAIVDRLIDSTENPNTKDDEGFTLLLRVSQTPSRECLSICQRLVQKGADINVCSPDGESALQLAVKNNNWPVVELLMNSGARFEVEILEGLHPVHNLIKSFTSSEDNELKLMTFLKDRGLSVSTQDSRGKTPAELAFTLKRWKLFKHLLESGAHLNPILRNGNSYFHELAKCFSHDDMNDIIRLLLSRGFDINLRNDDGDTPVHVAADKGNWDTVKTFVEHGANTNVLDSKGYCLLHKRLKKQTSQRFGYHVIEEPSTYKSHVELLRTFVARGEDVNRRGPDNKTALQLAVANHRWKVVGELISLGADLELSHDEKLSALEHLYCFAWESGAREKMYSFIKYITNDGSDINISFQNERGHGNPKTLLQKSVEKANLQVAIALVECGADVSQMLRDGALLQLLKSRYSGVDHTTRMRFLDLLISRGLDINTKQRGADTLVLDSTGHRGSAPLSTDLFPNKSEDFVPSFSDGNDDFISINYDNDSDNIIYYDGTGFFGSMSPRTSDSDDPYYSGGEFSYPQTQESSVVATSQDMAHPNKALPLSKMATELNTAAESSNWTLVNDLLSVDGVCRCDVEQCSLLHKLAAAPEVSLSLAGDILTKILKHKVDINMVDTSGDTAVVVAARCDNTKMVMELLSRQAALPPDVTHVCSFLQTLTNNWKPQETPYMHALVVKLLWDRLQDTALHSCHKQLHHTLVRLAVTFHTSLVREMFVTEQQVNSVDSEGMAVLHRVAMFDSDDHVRLLHYFISKGANVNLQNTSGDTPLHIAAKNSNWMMMEALLHRQAYYLPLLSRNNNDINKKDGEGNTALHLAALAGNLSLMTTLLGRGARADGVNNEQKTVLLMMAMTKRELFSNINSYINVLVLTVKRGADIQQKNCDGNSALHLAAKHDSWIMVEFLLKYVDDAGQPDSEGFNILHRLAIATSLQDHSLFHKVAQKVGDINAKSKTGDTAIHLAAKCQNWDMVKLLEQEGAAWDELDSEGFHIVHRYAMGKNMEHNMLSFLDISMYCNTRCWTGDTVFHLAARHGNWSVVELIVDYVDNIDKVDSNGLTVIQRLVMSATNTFSSEYSLFCRLIELGADYTCRDQNGDTVLHLAARNGHWQIVKHLTNLGAEVDTKDSEGFSILHRIATEEKRSDSVTAKELSQCGAIIKQKDLQGNTPLHLAVQHKNWAVAKDLVKCGADVNDVDAEGFTVLHRLGQIHNYDHSSLSLIELLLEKGARSDIVSNGGETVWKIVVQNENWRMMECLLASRRLVFKEHEDKYLLHNLVCSHQGDNHVELCDLIQKRLPVNAKDRDGNSLLHLAAGAGNWKLVKGLILKGARENMVDSKGLSILHRFVIGADRGMYSYNDTLDMIMDSGVSVNALDPRGNTALQIAAKRRLMGIVDRLIDSTENTNTKDDEGFTLLMRVSQTPSPECLSICQRLVQKGADINICSPDGESALHLAVRNNNWPVVELLMNSGARFEVEILEGLYPVHNLIKHSTFAEDSQLKLMTFLTYSDHSTSSEDSQLKLLTLLRDRDFLLAHQIQGERHPQNLHSHSRNGNFS
ncbi:uncharacterized protein LOC112558713 [Pomacea canaliculata]|uniref:uncharacterized protein LOC112558713 n=1 Tax=Pomacea canaliculata TaxID=400727 RepID=UPI000D739A43|nr:uncharacterized protein LOC112558713 [Pomacea canaliculata]